MVLITNTTLHFNRRLIYQNESFTTHTHTHTHTHIHTHIYMVKIQLIHLQIIFCISNLHVHLVGLITHSFTLHFTPFFIIKKKKKSSASIHVPIILNSQPHPSPCFYKSSASLIAKQTTVALWSTL